MERKLHLTTNDLKDKKCCMCKNILSVSPVRANLEVKQYVCGRCAKVELSTYFTIDLYEDIAKFLVFPCTYKGCNEEIPWGLVANHEINCDYRTIKCPVYYQDCNEFVPVTKIREHLKKAHDTNVWKYNEDVTLNLSYDYAYITTVDNLDFLIYILHLNNLFLINVLSVKPLTKYKMFNVKLTSNGDEEFSIVHENQKITFYDERQHCFKCLRKLCDVDYHFLSLDSFTKLKKDLVLSLADSENRIKYTLKLIPEETEPQPATPPKQQQKYSTRKSGRNIECPVCTEYLFAPIYICKSGHSICNACKANVKVCPTCRVELTDTRNFALEGIVDSLELHCEYKKKGCSFIGNTKQINLHEGACKFNK